MSKRVEWRPGLDPVTGMAAHPSTQGKTTAELLQKIASLDGDLATLDTLQPGPERDEYELSLRVMRSAYRRALQWRGVPL